MRGLIGCRKRQGADGEQKNQCERSQLCRDVVAPHLRTFLECWVVRQKKLVPVSGIFGGNTSIFSLTRKNTGKRLRQAFQEFSMVGNGLDELACAAMPTNRKNN